MQKLWDSQTSALMTLSELLTTDLRSFKRSLPKSDRVSFDLVPSLPAVVCDSCPYRNICPSYKPKSLCLLVTETFGMLHRGLNTWDLFLREKVKQINVDPNISDEIKTLNLTILLLIDYKIANAGENVFKPFKSKNADKERLLKWR